jgi:hypothetical protein
MSPQNFQQQQTGIQTLPQYTLTLDTLKPGQIQYKIENANHLLSQTPIITAKNLQNQQVTLNQVDEFLKLKQKSPGLIVKKDASAEDKKDKKAKFNLILQATPQKTIPKIQPSQIISATTTGASNTPNHKAQILNIEKILPIVNQASPTKQVVVPLMIRSSNEGRSGDAATQLLTQALSGNHGAENKTSIQQPFYMQMKLQSNADGQFTFTPATAAPQQIQLSLSPQQLQQLSFQTAQSQSSQPPPIQTQVISTAQDIQTQTIIQESPDKTENNEEEIFSDTYDNEFYQAEEENESQEKVLNKIDKKSPVTSKKSLKTAKPVKLKSKMDPAVDNNEMSTINPQHSEIAKNQLNLLTSYNNNSSKRIENENIDKPSDINLTVCDVRNFKIYLF